MKYLPYILKHLRRNWIRTTSTVARHGGVHLPVLHAADRPRRHRLQPPERQRARLWTRHAVSLSSTLPLSYKERIAAVPGVQRVANATWFNGIYQDPKNFFANFAVDMRDVPRHLPGAGASRPTSRRRCWPIAAAALIGRGLAEKFGWKIGDTVQLESTIPPYRIGQPVRVHGARHLRRRPACAIPAPTSSSSSSTTTTSTKSTNRRHRRRHVRGRDRRPRRAPPTSSKAIDALFENSDAQTKTETEERLRGRLHLDGRQPVAAAQRASGSR